MTAIRVAMVGVGQWGPNLLRNAARNPRAKLTVLCDRDSARLAEVSGKYPGVSLSESFDQLRTRDDVDAVILATPAGMHADQVEASLRSGLHVLVEKPIAMTARRTGE